MLKSMSVASLILVPIFAMSSWIAGAQSARKTTPGDGPGGVPQVTFLAHRLGTDRAAKPLENALHDLGNWDTACSLLTSLTKGVAEEVQVGVHRRRLDPELRTMTTNLSSVLRSLDVEDHHHPTHTKMVASLYIRHTPSHAADVHEAEEDPSTKRRKEVVFVMDQGFH